MKKTRKILTCGILGILSLVLPVVTVAGDLSNAGSFVVRHEDMEPYLKPNDIVTYSNSSSFDNLKTGDVIIFRAPEAKTDDGKPKVIVHRISEIGTISGKEVVTTKGDANPYSIPEIDFPIFEENYIGKVVSVIRSNMTNAYGQSNSDLYLEAKVFESPHVSGAHNLNITKFEGNLSEEICPSLQCKIDYKDKYNYFSPPDIPESTLIISTVEFRLHDNITHADLGPKKKELVEQYSLNLYCSVNDIVEENGQELYYCDNANINSYISDKFDDRSWVFNNIGIYDAKNNTLKVIGNFTDNSESASDLDTDTTGNLTDSVNLLNTTKLTEDSPNVLDTTNENELNTMNPFLNGAGSEKAKTFMDCYSGFASFGLLANMFTPANIELTNPELKGFFTNMCNFVHDETGKWLNILDTDEAKILMSEANVPADKFIMKYYPQGIPESLNKTFSQFGENFE